MSVKVLMLYFIIIIFLFYIHPCSSLPYLILPIIKLLGALKYIIEPFSFQSHSDHSYNLVKILCKNGYIYRF